jgi:hypothetical protein
MQDHWNRQTALSVVLDACFVLQQTEENTV